MGTLAEQLRKQLDALKAEPMQPGQDNIAGVLGAKSGTAAAGGAPGASALGEAAAQGQVKAAVEQEQQAGKLAVAGLAGQEAALAGEQQVADASLAATERTAQGALATQAATTREQTAATEQMTKDKLAAGTAMQVKQVNNAANMQLRKLATEKNISVNELFNTFERSNKELEFRRDAAELEQFGFMVAMQDQAYMDTIMRIGAERQLTNELKFREEMTSTILGDSMDRLLDDLNFKRSFNADDRQFQEYLASIDATAAMEIANAAIQAGNDRAMIEGGTTVVKEGLDYYAKNYEPSVDTSGGGGSPGKSGYMQTPVREEF